MRATRAGERGDDDVAMAMALTGRVAAMRWGHADVMRWRVVWDSSGLLTRVRGCVLIRHVTSRALDGMRAGMGHVLRWPLNLDLVSTRGRMPDMPSTDRRGHHHRNRGAGYPIRAVAVAARRQPAARDTTSTLEWAHLGRFAACFFPQMLIHRLTTLIQADKCVWTQW